MPGPPGWVAKHHPSSPDGKQRSVGPARHDYMKNPDCLVARAGSRGLSEKNERNDVKRTDTGKQNEKAPTA